MRCVLIREFGCPSLCRMRIQMKWGDDTEWNLGSTITDECQANFDATIEQAYEYGINHFETARGYGCSEKQFCQSLRSGAPHTPRIL